MFIITIQPFSPTTQTRSQTKSLYKLSERGSEPWDKKLRKPTSGNLEYICKNNSNNDNDDLKKNI